MVNWTLDIKTFEATFMAERMMAGAGKSEPPADFQSYILQRMVKKTASEIEMNIWRGNFTGATNELSGYTKFTGLLRQIDVASPTRVAGTTLSPSNIVAELQKMYNGILTGQTGATITERTDINIYCSIPASGFYKQAVATASAEKYYVGDVTLNFLGVNIIPLPGIPTNIMVGAPKDFLCFGTDVASDSNEVNIIDMRQTTNDYKFRYRSDFKAGTQVVNGSEIVLYK
jgi:hypothetical protein